MGSEGKHPQLKTQNFYIKTNPPTIPKPKSHLTLNKGAKK